MDKVILSVVERVINDAGILYPKCPTINRYECTACNAVGRINGGKGMEGKPLPVVDAILRNESHPSFTLKFANNKAIVTLANTEDRDSFVSLSSCKSWKLLRNCAWQSSNAPKGSGIIEQDHKHEGPWRIIFNGVSNLTELRGFGRDETSGRSENQAKKKKILTEDIMTKSAALFDV